MIHIRRKKTIHTLQPLKDSIGLKIPGVYCIPWNCGMVYIGQTNRSIEIGRKEIIRHLCLGQPDKSVVAGHTGMGNSKLIIVAVLIVLADGHYLLF
jgi:hypothetical protein